ncbi:MAG: hypothetical protein AAFX09_08205 [Pseudomonadota bacterium]
MGERFEGRDERQKLDDLNNEAAGRETGRIKRFHPDRDPATLEAKKQEDERRISALLRLLDDPAYRAAYDAAWGALEDAQTAVDEALIDAANAVERLTAYTDEMDARAHKLGNEAVFQDETGRFFRADGSALSDEETARVERSADAPSFEARRQAGDALEAAQARRAHILEIQATVLNPARARLEDQDNPMSRDELETLEEELTKIPHQVGSPSLGGRFTAATASIPQDVSRPPQELSLEELGLPAAP